MTRIFNSKRTTLAGIFCAAAGSVLLLCGAGSVPVENFAPQGPMQNDLNAGGHSVTNAMTLSATNVVVNGTNLNTNPPLLAGNNFSDVGSSSTALQNLGGAFSKMVAKSADFTVAGTDRGTIFNVTTGASNVAVTLPTASNGMFFAVRKADSGAGLVTVNGAAVGTSGHLVEVMCDGTSFYNKLIAGSVDASGNYTYTVPGNANYTRKVSGSGEVLSPAGFTSMAGNPVLLGLSWDGGHPQTLFSRDGVNWSVYGSSFTVPSGLNIRDAHLLKNNDGTPRKYGGKYFACATTGNFGSGDYFAIFWSYDLMNWTFLEDVPLLGLSGAVATTVTTTSGSATITLPSTAITGLTNGQVYSVQGNANIPVEAAFVYNSASTTQTLGYMASATTISGSVTATASGSSVATSLVFANNTWMGSWFVDTDGTVGIACRVSTVSGNSYGTPGLGYVTFSDPGTFRNYSNWTALTISAGTTGFTPSALNMGSIYYDAGTYYLVCDGPKYGTATSARGPYTMQGSLSVAAGDSSEGGQLYHLGGNNWICYVQDTQGGGDFAAYTTTTGGLAGSWSAVTLVNAPSANNVQEIDPCVLSNTDDIAMAAAIGSFQPNYHDEQHSFYPTVEYVNGWTDTNLLFKMGCTLTGSKAPLLNSGTTWMSVNSAGTVIIPGNLKVQSGASGIDITNSGPLLQEYSGGFYSIQPNSTTSLLIKDSVVGTMVQITKGASNTNDLKSFGTVTASNGGFVDGTTANHSALLKENSSGVLVAATAGTDFPAVASTPVILASGTTTFSSGTATITNGAITATSKLSAWSVNGTPSAHSSAFVPAAASGSMSLKALDAADSDTINYVITN